MFSPCCNRLLDLNRCFSVFSNSFEREYLEIVIRVLLDLGDCHERMPPQSSHTFTILANLSHRSPSLYVLTLLQPAAG
jgi:hypothetical protein